MKQTKTERGLVKTVFIIICLIRQEVLLQIVPRLFYMPKFVHKGKLYTGPKKEDGLEDLIDALPHVCVTFTFVGEIP